MGYLTLVPTVEPDGEYVDVASAVLLRERQMVAVG